MADETSAENSRFVSMHIRLNAHFTLEERRSWSRKFIFGHYVLLETPFQTFLGKTIV